MVVPLLVARVDAGHGDLDAHAALLWILGIEIEVDLVVAERTGDRCEEMADGEVDLRVAGVHVPIQGTRVSDRFTQRHEADHGQAGKGE